jgi:hypothetical protein
MRRSNFIAALLGVSLAIMPIGAFALTSSERTALHVAMVQHIDRNVVDGLYLQMDLANGKVNKFSPAKSHPMLLTMGEHFVLCTDFKDEAGNATNVDFYVARRVRGFAVFHTEINNRGPLQKLMEDGKAKMVE